ncbi:hypothetical protein ACF0H5_003134 [Mactra antiquata]
MQRPLQDPQQIQSKQVPSGIVQQNPVINILPTNPPVQARPNNNQNSVLNQQNNGNNAGQQDIPDIPAPISNNDASSNNIPLNKNEHINTDVDHNIPKSDRQTPPPRNYGYHHQSQMETGGSDYDDDNDVKHRHSSEEDDDVLDNHRTYPPATKTKTQIGSPTQSTVPGQKTSHTNSEGFSDFPWLTYDSDSPKVSGKKGKTVDTDSKGSEDTDSDKKNIPSKIDDGISPDKQNMKDDSLNREESKPSKKPMPNSRYDNQFDYNRYDVDGRFPDDYRNYDDYRRPAGNRRPGYDRYNNRYEGTGNRRRPSPGQAGSRYPYYPDSGYQRNRDRYPVWDPYKDEYYYPEEYDDNHDYDFRTKTGT